MKLIDMHCHAFPDAIAPHALNVLTQNCEYKPVTDGTLSDTIRVQKEWGCKQFVLLNIATNDALAGSAKNISMLMNYKNYYFVPMGQDDFVKKPASLIGDFDQIPMALMYAMVNKQIQPFFCTG